MRPKILRAIGLLWLFSCILLLSAIQSTLADLPPPAAASILTTVDSAGNVGWHTSLALNGNGYPVISYRDWANDDLKVAVCHDVTCTNPTPDHGGKCRYCPPVHLAGAQQQRPSRHQLLGLYQL
ncbi:MAG: hypothetical protein M5U34_44895 [Chloroflexi bacterium]|nr:hypothetical protein [Chloroflexota bacterium]